MKRYWIFLVMFAACTGRTSVYRPVSIGEFKRILDSAIRSPDSCDLYLAVEGYYVNEKTPMLVSNLAILRRNVKLPDSTYLLLSGQGIDSLVQQENNKKIRADLARMGRLMATTYEGAYVSADVHLKIANHHLTRLIVNKRPTILRKAQAILSSLVNHISPQAPPTATTKDNYALFYSGGIDSVNAHLRYWNDLEFMYTTLKEKYGFDSTHIIIIYADGKSEDNRMPVNYPATAAALKTAMTQIKNQLTPNSTLFTFFTNHGGGYDTLAGVMEGGRPDENADEEPDDLKKWDEQLYFYQQTPNDLWDDSLTVLFSALPCKRQIILAESCFGGGLIHDLRRPGRIIFSAANQYEQSFGDFSVAGTDFDTFSYYFTCALNGSTYDGKPVTADSNGDGKVSILEAFQYAKSMDKEMEHPQMETSLTTLAANTWF